MKKRRGILFALGIVLSLSVAVPAVAAENVTGTTVTQDSVENEQAQEASKENETDAAQIPQIQDEEKTADADGKEKEVTPTWEKYETENGDVWRLKLGESTPPDNDGYARDTVYTNNGNTYYINKDRDMSTGYVKVDDSATDPSADKLEPGLYYFSKEGNDPSADTLGSMLKDCWAQEADENGAWHYLGSDGKAVNTGEKAGWQQPEKDWYYLKEDGTMATGELIIDNKKYTFDENGVWDGKSTAVKTTGSGPMVALTFDDGPGQYTERILNTLAANGAKATFFMLGTNIPNYPDAVKKMESLGCELANHTFDHKDLATLDTTAIQNEVSSTNDKLNALVGHGASLVRPPYGSYNSTVKSVIGFPMILWSIDTLDWKTKNAQSTYEAAMTAQDGDVILMHDIHGPTADAVDMIVPALKAKGFQMVTVSELAAAKGINLENGGAYGALR